MSKRKLSPEDFRIRVLPQLAQLDVKTLQQLYAQHEITEAQLMETILHKSATVLPGSTPPPSYEEMQERSAFAPLPIFSTARGKGHPDVSSSSRSAMSARRSAYALTPEHGKGKAALPRHVSIVQPRSAKKSVLFFRDSLHYNEALFHYWKFAWTKISFSVDHDRYLTWDFDSDPQVCALSHTLRVEAAQGGRPEGQPDLPYLQTVYYQINKRQ